MKPEAITIPFGLAMRFRSTARRSSTLSVMLQRTISADAFGKQSADPMKSGPEK